jgi:hypothetical protein
MATPTPRAALVTGKAFAAGVRAISQVIVVLVLSALLGVSFDWNPLHLVGAAAAVVLGSVFFSTLSMSIAGMVLTRERLMGIGQAITMPLFFASNALYPVAFMPSWVGKVAAVNPLSYEVNALRKLLLGLPGNLWIDFGVLILSSVVGVAMASASSGGWRAEPRQPLSVPRASVRRQHCPGISWDPEREHPPVAGVRHRVERVDRDAADPARVGAGTVVHAVPSHCWVSVRMLPSSSWV